MAPPPQFAGGGTDAFQCINFCSILYKKYHNSVEKDYRRRYQPREPLKGQSSDILIEYFGLLG
jgi:hypothetical protein